MKIRGIRLIRQIRGLFQAGALNAALAAFVQDEWQYQHEPPAFLTNHSR